MPKQTRSERLVVRPRDRRDAYPKVRLLGADVGERRIGLAIGDPDSGVVRALTTIRRVSPAADAVTLRRLADEQGATELVVGLPLLADGSEGSQAALTRAWASSIEDSLGLPVVWRDERNTSQAAESRIGAARRGRSGGPPTAGAMRAYRARVDREAAASIVQAELDARKAGA
ncbi:MAG: putative pre6S rRNA nuclease [Chloroflexota bacterium]|jgi:putative Holliday junction resolvase|nr:putative pre6S rRNA nuclease [Chloroflexota bacterium]